MKRIIGLVFAAAIFTMSSVAIFSQPPDGRDTKGGGPGQKGGAGAGHRFKIGQILPPRMHDELELSDEQRNQIADLEKEVKGKLESILTPDQRSKIESMQPPGPNGGQGKSKSKGRPQDGKGGKKGEKGPPPGNSDPHGENTAGIQWYPVLQDGLDEAKRTNRPIMLVSAAPHCAGVPGIW